MKIERHTKQGYFGEQVRLHCGVDGIELSTDATPPWTAIEKEAKRRERDDVAAGVVCYRNGEPSKEPWAVENPGTYPYWYHRGMLVREHEEKCRARLLAAAEKLKAS